MATAKKFLDLTGLSYFKTKQDAYNATLYVPLASKGQANGVAPLDASAKVASTYLPSYVDDVESYPTLAQFPAEGETGKLYLDESTEKLYRWVPASEPTPEHKGEYVNVSGSVSVADEAIKLQTARKINGVDFDGTADITINAEDATPRIAVAEKAAANGVATLDVNTLVPVAQLPLATASTAGAVVVGTNIDVTSGTISVATATNAALGVAQAGTNIDVAAGVFSVKTGSASDKGVLQVCANLDVADGVVSVKKGSTTDFGLLKVGDNITVTDSVISLAKASDAVFGVVKVGSNIVVGTEGNAGVISVPEASASTKGVVKVGENITVGTGDAAGTISVATADTTTKGVVQVGENINVASGVISVNTGTDAQKGVLQVGTNLAVANGVVSVATATNAALGVAQAGTNIDVAAGVFSVKTGSATDKGVVKVGDNITVGTGDAAGTISITSTNVENALGYSMTELTNSDIDTLFA